MPLAVLGLGILAAALLLGTDQIRQRAIVEDLELLKAVGEIELGAATSHLWLEEYVTGDEVDVLDIYENLDRSQGLVRAMLGERSSAGGVPVAPLLEEPYFATARSLAADIEEFRELSIVRQTGFEAGQLVGIGSAIDVQYDAVFRDLLTHAQSLATTLEQRMVRSRERSRLVFQGILLAWCGIVGFATFGLWTRERRRLQAESALRDSQAQLIQSQKMDAVGRLAGGLAHDINNYLAAVRGHCELVSMRRGDDPWISRKMDAAIRVVEKSSGLIDRLQTFSRQENLQLEVININRIIEGLEKVMGPSVGEEIRIETQLAEDLWNIKIDPSQIEQVLVNFLLNAQEAMPDGGSLTLATSNISHADSAAEEVLIRVSDTGGGIPSELRDKIFEPFVTTKADDGRRGLGLAIVYSIVKQHAGRIKVESSVGKGTTFEVYFPRVLEPETLAEAVGMESEEELRGTECLLLVDDNEEFRRSTRNLLAALGYEVLSAGDGAEALEIFEQRQEEIQLVLTDVVMPGLSGPEVVERMRRQRPVKALFMSAHTDKITLRHGIAEGQVHFVKKLFSAKELARLVRELLDSTPEA